MGKVPALAVLLALSCAATTLHAQTRGDIVQLQEKFLSSRFAAERCGAVDEGDKHKFMSNFMDLTLQAIQILKERNPDWSDDDLKRNIADRTSSLQNNIASEIEKNGCKSPIIQQLLASYRVHSEMNLSAGRR